MQFWSCQSKHFVIALSSMQLATSNYWHFSKFTKYQSASFLLGRWNQANMSRNIMCLVRSRGVVSLIVNGPFNRNLSTSYCCYLCNPPSFASCCICTFSLSNGLSLSLARNHNIQSTTFFVKTSFNKIHVTVFKIYLSSFPTDSSSAARLLYIIRPRFSEIPEGIGYTRTKPS